MSLMLHRAGSFSALSLTPPLPFGARLAMIGDSVLWAQSGTGEGASGHSNAASVVNIGSWANALSGGRLFLPSYWNQAIGGQSSSTIAARFETSLAPVDPDIVLLNAGTNNLSDGSAAILGHFEQMLAIAAAHDWRVIIIPILPRSSNDSTRETTRAAANAGLAAMTSDSVYVADIDFFDYAVHCYPQVSTEERVHPNIIGAKLLANAIQPAIARWVQSGNPLLADTDPSSNLFPNGYNTGTGGTTTGATGTLPTGWTFSPDSNHGNIAATFSRVTRDEGGHWLQMSLSGDYDEGDRAGVTYTANLAGAFTEAQRIDVSFAIEVDGDVSNVDSFYVGTTLFASDFSAVVFGASGYVNTVEEQGGFNVPAYSGIIRMEPMNLPAGKVPGNMLVEFIAWPRFGQPHSTSIAGTARIGAISIRVVPAETPWPMAAPSLTPDDGEISVDRAAAPYRNGAPITGYELRHSTDETNWTTVSMTSDPQTIGGLESGTEYFVQTRAINSAGYGPWSESASATPEQSAPLYETNFSSNAGWTLPSGITISGGTLNFTSVAQWATASRTLSLPAGSYRLTWTLQSITSGRSARVVLGNASGSYRSTPGTYAETLLVSSGSLLEIQAVDGGGTTAVVDNVMIEAL